MPIRYYGSYPCEVVWFVHRHELLFYDSIGSSPLCSDGHGYSKISNFSISTTFLYSIGDFLSLTKPNLSSHFPCISHCKFPLDSTMHFCNYLQYNQSPTYLQHSFVLTFTPFLSPRQFSVYFFHYLPICPMSSPIGCSVIIYSYASTTFLITASYCLVVLFFSMWRSSFFFFENSIS